MKIKIILTLFLLNVLLVSAQEGDTIPPSGEISAKIYTLFNYSLDRDNPATAFEVRRAYFGYKRNLNNHFSGEVKLDIGSVDDDSEYSLIRRYTYFKNAYLSYSTGNIKTWFGLFDMLQFKVQERFWGYRYLYKSYLDQYNFGSSADLGAGIQYTPSEKFSTDLIISNGEGYKNLQFDNIDKVGAGITFSPIPELFFRTYYTIHTAATPQMSFAGFVGYKVDKIRLAGEYNWQRNYQFNKNHNRYGYSFYTTYTFSEKWEVFARYDQLFSNIIPEQDSPWNLVNDGSAIIGGIQYTPLQAVHISLNYQDWVEYAQNGGSEPYLYLNLEIVF